MSSRLSLCLLAAVFLASLVAAPLSLAQTPLDLATSNLPSGLQWKAKDVGLDTSADPAQPNYKDDDWAEVEVPGDLTAAGVVGEQVNFWYRLTGLKIPSDWPKDRYLILSNFNVDDGDKTYFNGHLIGSTQGYNTQRSYIIPPEYVDYTGTNTIAIFGNQGSGAAGMTTYEPILELGPADSGVVLITATDAKGKGVAGIGIEIKIGTNTITDQTDSGITTIQNVPAGTGTIEAISQPWSGNVKPAGPQPITIKGGSAVTLSYSVEPYVYTVVKADKPMKMDGNLTDEEWAGAAVMTINVAKQVAVVGTWDGPDDCSGTVRWKWDDTYIYAAMDITDNVRVNTHTDPSDGNLWQGDGVETYIQLDPYDPKRNTTYTLDRDYQWTIGVGDPPSWKIFQAGHGDWTIGNGEIPDWRPDNMAVVDHPKGQKPGYIVEARFPWASLPGVNKSLIPPKVNTEGAIGLAINDTDTPDSATREKQMMWNGYGDLWTNPAHFTRAIWGDVPSTAAPVVKGDLSGDGKLGVNDAVLALQIAVGVKTATADQLKAGDLNGDGKIGINEVTLILQAAVGLRTL
jgi:hypothetical protein